MGQPTALQGNWSAGMKRDYARTQLPPNSSWNSVDLILNFGAPLRQRGGWTAGSDVTFISTAASLRAGVYAIFATSAGGTNKQNLALDEDGILYNVTASGTGSVVSASTIPAQNPIFHGGTAVSAATAVYTGLVIMPDSTGAAAPTKYDGVTLSGLGGNPPQARFATVYKDYTVLGNGSVASVLYPNRIWFSPPGDPDCAVSGAVTAWDTTDSWIDFSQPVRGFGSMKNALLVFHDDHLSRVRGSVPPPDQDMTVDDPMFNIGLLDPFSIVEYKDTIIWAAPEGLFRTDGTSIDDLTRKGGMLRYWLDTVPDNASGFTFAGGVIRDTYVLSVMSGTTFIDAFLIDLSSYSWVRLSNLKTSAMWSGLQGDADELYFGRRDTAKTGLFSSVFTPGGANDGDNTAITPVWESPFYTLGTPGLKRLRRVFVGYQLEPTGVSTPTGTMYFTTDPTENAAYTTVTPPMSTFQAGDGYKRIKRDVNRQAPGVAFKITRSLQGEFSLWDVGVEQSPAESSRIAA